MSAFPTSKTKIVVPRRRAELLTRPRLLDSFSACLDHKLILLIAPAGYGKTSLLIDLANYTDWPVCWLSLDQLDRDPQRFMAYLIASIEEQYPGVGGASRAILSELRSFEQDAESLLVTLTNALFDRTEQDFLLILDDYHHIDDSETVSVLLNRFLQLVDENCHVVLSSRIPPSLPVVMEMVAREQVDGLGDADLAFLPQEIQAFFAQNHHQHISDAAAQELALQTGGWITGLLLADLKTPHAADRERISRAAGVDTFVYLGRQVLDQQPAALREFLLRTSLPDEFNVELCEAILSPLHSGPQDWSSLMSMVLERSLYVLPVGADGRWLRYHPLFRDFLQKRLQEERPTEVRPILERLIQEYSHRGEWEKAYHTCRQLGDPESLAILVEQAGTPMIQHAMLTLENWINSLPPHLVRTRAGLISLRGSIVTMKGDVREGVEFFNQAESAYRQGSDSGGLALTLIRRATALLQLGNYTSSMKDVEEALQLAESRADLQPLYAEALRVKGLNLYRLGQSRQAVESFEHSLTLYTALKETGSIPLLLMDAGMAYAAIGTYEASKAAYQKALEIWRAENNIYSQAILLNNLAVLHYQLGEYEQAIKDFEAGLDCARKSRNTRTETFILLGLGDLYAEIEEFESAAQAYQQADALARQTNEAFIINYLILARANLAIVQGKATEARQILEENKAVLQASFSNYDQGFRTLLEGRIHLAEDHRMDAVKGLQESKTYFARDGRDLESLRACVWLSAALSYTGNKEASRDEIQNLIAKYGQTNHGLLISLYQAGPWLRNMQKDPGVGRSLSALLEKADKIGSKLPAIRRGLRRLTRSVQIPSAGLNIRAFGRAEVQVNGRTVTMSNWHTQSVRDLFFYFLYTNKPLTKEQIGQALWPEVDDPRTLKMRFRNEMYRLRRAVGKDVILFDDEYYRFNWALDYDYDVEDFETQLARARSAPNQRERIECYQRAVDLVRGPYLIDVDNRWIDEERERLGQRHLAALEELAALYLSEGEIEQSISTCMRTFEFDRYRESVYRLAMRAYGLLENRPAIVRLYKDCQNAMQELGLPVSDETETLYLELTSGKKAN